MPLWWLHLLSPVVLGYITHATDLVVLQEIAMQAGPDANEKHERTCALSKGFRKTLCCSSGSKIPRT